MVRVDRERKKGGESIKKRKYTNTSKGEREKKEGNGKKKEVSEGRRQGPGSP